MHLVPGEVRELRQMVVREVREVRELRRELDFEGDKAIHWELFCDSWFPPMEAGRMELKTTPSFCGSSQFNARWLVINQSSHVIGSQNSGPLLKWCSKGTKWPQAISGHAKLTRPSP